MTRRLAGALFWLLALLAGSFDERRAEPLPVIEAVPCSTDQDCQDKNPGAIGLYAFPEKATP